MWTKYFKKRPGRLQSSLTAKLLHGIEFVQQRWADYMNTKTARLSVRQRKMYFLSFCLLFAFANGCVMYQALTRRDVPASQQWPVVSKHAPAMPKESEAVLTEGEKNALRSLRRRLDSLSATPEGKAQLESFLNTHQGFADSLLKAEELIK